jgi:NTE family protein
MLEPSTKARPISVEQRPPFERIALLLQGGGALGSYQAGVYEALTEASLQPDWVAGISIGAVNAALIAGNVPEKRVEKLREFWEAVSTPPLGVPYLKSIEVTHELTRRVINQTRAFGNLLFGAPNFFTPRMLPPYFGFANRADAVSYYDVTPLRSTLERLVDFDCINSNRMRFSVGAVNVRTGLLRQPNGSHRFGAYHCQWLTATWFSCDRDRGRVLLGWWSCVQYPSAMDAGQQAPSGHACLSGRFVECGR